MGAQWFELECNASSPQEGFNRLKGQADWYDGHDMYNGSINTTDLSKTIVIAKKYSEAAKKKAEKNMEKYQNECSKWHCYCIDLGVIAYESYKVKKTTYKPKRPELQYEVKYNGSSVKQFKTLAAARKFAKGLVALGKDYSIYKNYGNVALETGIVQSNVLKRASKKATAIHSYIYCGWAGC